MQNYTEISENQGLLESLPLILNNDIIIVRKGCPRSVSGKICVVNTGDNETTLKKVTLTSSEIRLSPINPQYPDLVYPVKEAKQKGVEVLGVMIQSVRSY